MHGECHDFVVLNTVKNGHERNSGGSWDIKPIQEVPFYKRLKKDYQPIKRQRKFKKILEVGSLDINGSQKAYNFMGGKKSWLEVVSDTEDYTGIDMVDGRGVDVVMNAHDLKFEKNTFDLVLCLNMLEHDDNIKATFDEMYMVMKYNGLLIASYSNETGSKHGSSKHFKGVSDKDIDKCLDKFRGIWKVRDGSYGFVKARK